MKYRLISVLYPKRVKDNYKKLLDYANVKIEINKFIGFIIFFGAGLSVAIAFYLTIFNAPILISFILSFAVLQLIIYFWLLLKVNAKSVYIEMVLPDALQLMASNLKAGMTVDRALLLSARAEFGPLKDEINRVGKEITIGRDISESLLGISKRIKSDKLEKTLRLIVTGLNSGGELASLLEQTSRNLRTQEFVEQKVRSNVRMYVLFIFTAIGFGAPLLFGLSSFLVEVITNIVSQVEFPKISTVNLPLSLFKVNISSSFIMSYIIISLITTATLGSLMLGLINKGEEKYGIKLIPALIGISILVFFLVRYLISNLLSGLFNL